MVTFTSIYYWNNCISLRNVYKYSIGLHCQTLAKTGGYLINGRPRKLHPRECARLMGYPDSYEICASNNQAYKQFGNSVVVDVLQYIAMEIGNTLLDKDSFLTLS